jgi:NADH-ubiquinone oxidoreductase chain 5
MIFACGLSQYAVSFFHLFNHAFFKALLFLTAGCIIHAMSDEQDIRKMGNLVSLLPFSYTMFLIGSLALAGLPFISGFYSKDAILELAMSSNFYYGYFCYVLGVLAAFCTAFYSFKAIILVFFNKPAGYRFYYENCHEPNLYMVIPLAFLCFLSMFSGFIFKDLFIGLGTDFWTNSLFTIKLNTGIEESEFLISDLKLIPLYFTSLGVILSILVYQFNLYEQFKKYVLATNINFFFSRKWHFDFIYNVYVSNVFYNFSRVLIFKNLDRGLIEFFGSFGLGKLVNKMFVYSTNFFQSGYLFNYLQLIIFGILSLIVLTNTTLILANLEFLILLILFYILG